LLFSGFTVNLAIETLAALRRTVLLEAAVETVTVPLLTTLTGAVLAVASFTAKPSTSSPQRITTISSTEVVLSSVASKSASTLIVAFSPALTNILEKV